MGSETHVFLRNNLVMHAERTSTDAVCNWLVRSIIWLILRDTQEQLGKGKGKGFSRERERVIERAWKGKQ